MRNAPCEAIWHHHTQASFAYSYGLVKKCFLKIFRNFSNFIHILLIVLEPIFSQDFPTVLFRTSILSLSYWDINVRHSISGKWLALYRHARPRVTDQVNNPFLTSNLISRFTSTVCQIFHDKTLLYTSMKENCRTSITYLVWAVHDKKCP